MRGFVPLKGGRPGSTGDLDITDVNVPVAGRTSVRGRIYVPHGGTARTALLWIHGGGFVAGSIDMREGDAVARAVARAGVPVLSVDYRLVPRRSRALTHRGAPAVRFPAPIDDCAAAWKLLVELAGPLGISADALTIGGASAGGNLAVMTSLRVPRIGLPRPAGVFLAYPLLHATLPQPADGRRMRRPAITNRWVAWMAACFVGADHTDRLTDAFPRRTDLDGFPRTLIYVCERDGLRPSAEAFAADLREREVDVDERLREGARHGYLTFPKSPHFGATIAGFAAWLERRSAPDTNDHPQ